MKPFLILILALGASLLTRSALAGDAGENWKKHCAKCHGDDGKGKTKMGEKLKVKDYSDPKVQAEMKEDKMAEAIKEGVKEGDKTKMKGHKGLLSDQEIAALVKHIRSMAK